MTTTDIIVLALSVLYVARGFARGFMRSVMFPIAFVLGTVVSVIYYQVTQDFILSLLIAFLGPFVLYFLLVLLLKFFIKASYADTEPHFISRVAGGALSLAWIWMLIVPTIILLALMPTNNRLLMRMHKDITRSVAYKKTAIWSNNFLPIYDQTINKLHDPSSTLEFQSLAQDPRFQKVLQDPETQQEINNHDIAKLMSNPKMIQLTQQIMSDPQMMKKLLAAWHNQTQSISTENQR